MATEYTTELPASLAPRSDILSSFVRFTKAPAGLELVFSALLFAYYTYLHLPFAGADAGLRQTVYRGPEIRSENVLDRSIGRYPAFTRGTRAVPGIASKNRLAIRWDGNIRVPETGEYTFAVRVDDGVRVAIDGELLIDDWGERPDHMVYRSAFLEQGTHRIRIDYRQVFGDALFRLFWKVPGASSSAEIPLRQFSRGTDESEDS